MRHRFLAAMGVLALTVALLQLAPVTLEGQESRGTPPAAKAGPAPKTPWGEPDLQGIWTYEFQVPFERNPKYADREFFTAAEIKEFDRQRAAQQSRDFRAERGSEADVAGAYNAVFLTLKHSGRRTSMVVDPPNGRIPPTTPAFQKQQAADRAFGLALLAPTETCKQQLAGCAGGKYDPNPSPRRNEVPPSYLTAAINRNNGPEDRSMGERCLLGSLPEFGTAFGGSYRRIVQTPGGITIFYDQGQGQGFQRNIVMNGSPHLPSTVRQWFGDSRGHWEGNTLVIDVTNFSEKTNFRGSRENLHLIERWTRTDSNTLEYAVTIEDPTVWTKPWTVKQDFAPQSNEANRIYYEPRCAEGNYGLPAMLLGTRMEDAAFAEGRGPDPATRCTAGCTFGPSEETVDLLQ
jgi:hypothetical protein